MFPRSIAKVIGIVDSSIDSQSLNESMKLNS